MQDQEVKELLESIDTNRTWLDFKRFEIICYGSLRAAYQIKMNGGISFHIKSIFKVDGKALQIAHDRVMVEKTKALLEKA